MSPTTASERRRSGGPTARIIANERNLARIMSVRRAPREAWRGDTYTHKRSYADHVGVTLRADASEAEVDSALEIVLHEPDFLPSRWLADGAKRCDAVARLLTPTKKGTGFLVSPWLLITNNHVLPNAEHAADTEVTFRYEEDGAGNVRRSKKVRLDPGRCFVTSPVKKLDYTVVAVTPDASGKAPGRVFGTIPMMGTTRKILSGQPVNIIQHPDGRTREVALRNNLLIGVDDKRYLTYETDSEPGSSGSPVLNDRWELVALHSRVESARNDRGDPIDADGRLVTDDTDEAQRVWVANKGVRVSAIVADIKARATGPSHGTDAATLITELLDVGGNR